MTTKLFSELKVGSWITAGPRNQSLAVITKVTSEYFYASTQGKYSRDFRVNPKTGKEVGSSHYWSVCGEAGTDEDRDAFQEARQKRFDEVRAREQEALQRQNDELQKVKDANPRLRIKAAFLDLLQVTVLDKQGQEAVLLFKTSSRDELTGIDPEGKPVFESLVRLENLILYSKRYDSRYSPSLPSSTEGKTLEDALYEAIQVFLW